MDAAPDSRRLAGTGPVNARGTGTRFLDGSRNSEVLRLREFARVRDSVYFGSSDREDRCGVYGKEKSQDEDD